jgi:hypothetical protein
MVLRWRWHHTDAYEKMVELPLSRHADAMRTSGFPQSSMHVGH